MKIPNKLGELLQGHAKLRGPVLMSADKFDPWLKANKSIFFPEYTDHSIEHVESVLASAEGLLSERTWEILTGEDAAVLILAIILHDSAMHLSLNGFFRLIDPAQQWPVEGASERFMKAMSDPPWPELWDEFLREANRFDQQKLVALFGRPEPIRRPPAVNAGWKDEDYLLVGEFLRRHHARLAHEIAHCGVPGPGAALLQFAGIEPWMADVAGFLARSHNMDLRLAVEQLSSHDRPVLRRVHVPLLMTAVRVADYLELQSERAPGELLQVHQLRSPVSQQAWRDHAAVKDIKVHPDDPESIWIDAEPEDVKTFLSMTRLQKGLQSELDACWAVLGEVYRGDPRFGLRLRRVHSTIDDVRTLSENVEYVPVDASFQAAGGDLLKLLVGPLYEHHPAYGVRELIQNAVDAVRELDDVRTYHPLEVPLDVTDLGADVVVSLRQENDEVWLTVEDRGIGMSAEIIVNYFLRVGATFRSSESWRQMHGDAQGRPRVVRAGRFGIGALAAFLLGDEIEIETRRFDERYDRGVKFIARLEDPQVELCWSGRPIGTTVKVRLRAPDGASDVIESLADIESWDWYRLNHPSVERTIRLEREVRVRGAMRRDDAVVPPGKEIHPAHAETIPHGDAAVPAPWRLLHQSVVNEVLWCPHQGGVSGWEDVCNGFALKMPSAWRGQSEVLWPLAGQESDIVLRRPRLSVLDPSSVLGIDLRRTLFTDVSILRESLTKAVCRDILASIVVRTAGNREEALLQIVRSTTRINTLRDLWHPGVGIGRARAPGLGGGISSWLFVTKDGLALEDPALLRRVTPIGLCVICRTERSTKDLEMLTFDGCSKALARIPPEFAVGYQTDVLGREELNARRARRGYQSIVSLWTTKDWKNGMYMLADHKGLTSTTIGRGWVAVHEPDVAVPDKLSQFASSPPENEGFKYDFYFYGLIEYIPAPRNPLSRLWLELFGYHVVPFDAELRQLMFAAALTELQEEVGLWQKMIAVKGDEYTAAASYWVDPKWARETESVTD